MIPGSATTLEFAGLPGSGKSYWASFTARELTAAGRPVRMPRESLAALLPIRAMAKARSATRAILGEPRVPLATVRPLIRSQSSPLEGFRRSLQWLDTQARLSSAVPAQGVLIMDEGPLQALWSVGLGGDWETALKSLERYGYKRADLAVVLDVSPGTALARLEGRDEVHRRLDRISEAEDRLALLERGFLLLQDLVAAWSERHGPETVIRLDAEQPVQTAEHIRDLLASSPKG
ncbi:MAG: hypothetical protein ACRDVL_01200 [Acidimicrobiia bacterium]